MDVQLVHEVLSTLVDSAGQKRLVEGKNYFYHIEHGTSHYSVHWYYH